MDRPGSMVRCGAETKKHHVIVDDPFSSATVSICRGLRDVFFFLWVGRSACAKRCGLVCKHVLPSCMRDESTKRREKRNKILPLIVCLCVFVCSTEVGMTRLSAGRVTFATCLRYGRWFPIHRLASEASHQPCGLTAYLPTQIGM